MALAAKGKPDQASAEQKKLDAIAAAIPPDSDSWGSTRPGSARARIGDFGGEIGGGARRSRNGNQESSRRRRDSGFARLRGAAGVGTTPLREDARDGTARRGPNQRTRSRSFATIEGESRKWMVTQPDSRYVFARETPPDEIATVEDRFKKPWAHADVARRSRADYGRCCAKIGGLAIV